MATGVHMAIIQGQCPSCLVTVEAEIADDANPAEVQGALENALSAHKANCSGDD